jgi:hypothetical protein
LDPNEALKVLRAISARILRNIDEDVPLDGDEVNTLCESFQALDEWIAKKGFLPEAWKP